MPRGEGENAKRYGLLRHNFLRAKGTLAREIYSQNGIHVALQFGTPDPMDHSEK